MESYILSYNCDLFVIGAGSGGVRAGRIAASLGAKVIVAERDRAGGTCVNVGCVPKKLFHYAATYPEAFEGSQGYGWDIDVKGFSWEKLLKAKDEEILRLNGIYEKILGNSGVEFIYGDATIISPNEVQINNQVYTCGKILIAVGGKADRLNVPGKENFLISDNLFTMRELPKKMLIIGGGYIAVEFACIFHGLGVEVDLVYRGPLFLRGFDEECRRFLAESMKERGINVMFNTNVTEARKEEAGVSVTLTDGSIKIYDQVLSATGRSPALDDLGLANSGVEVDGRGYIKVNENYQTNVDNIYAVGDCTPTIQLTPVALGEGMYLAHQLFGDKSFPRPDYHSVASTIFTQPEMAVWGMAEEVAIEKFSGDLDVYTSTFRPMRNILAGSNQKMFMKIIVRKSTDEIIGLFIIGDESGEIMQGFAVALANGVTKKGFDRTIGIHPTAAEELVTMRMPTRSI